MSGGKQTPRQAMIGLMYLVLLAMLAMNASKSLLDAFVMLERGIDKTVKNFSENNKGFYDRISNAATKIQRAKVIDVKAQKIKAKANEVYDVIEADKKFLITQIDNSTEQDMIEACDDAGVPFQKDNQDIGAQYYLLNDAPSDKGVALKKLVDEFRVLVVEVIMNDGISENDLKVKDFEEMLNTHDHKDGDGITHIWISQLSEHLPMASVTANLTLWQSYIRNVEAEVVGSLANSLDGQGMVVNAIDAMAVFESGYVLKGDTLKSDIFISAYNKDVTPVVYTGTVDTTKLPRGGKWLDPTAKASPPIIGAAKKISVKGGKGRYSVPANEVGVGKLTGVIGIPSQKGIEYHAFEQGYMVAEPTATIAATAMNVFYVGVDNPVAISAPGASLDELEIRGAGISFRKGKKPGTYIARASKANPRGTEVNVMKKGGTKLGGMKFRVKRLPDPVATILNQKEGLVSKGKLKAATFLKAQMENFDFDVKVNVKQFKMTINIDGDLKEFVSKNNKLTAQMRTMLSRVKRGNRVYFEDIKVKLPDGTTRKVPSIILKVR